MDSLVPVVETERLRLRGHRLDDFEECCAMWGDPVVTRHIGGKPFPPDNVWTKLLRYVGHWSLLGFGYWVIEERASNRFVGEVGLADFKRPVDPPFGDSPEVGWVLAAWAHGRGYATEALSATLGWSDRRWPERRTVCMIDEANVASLRVAAKCGYREWTRTVYQTTPVMLFER